MKILLLLLTFFLGIKTSKAQLKTTPVCPAFTVDVLDGNVNKLYAKSTWAEVTNLFPCYTKLIEKDSATVCAGVFYPDKGIYFFTDRDYIEIKDNFKGKMTPHLLGANRSSLFATLGYPKIKDLHWDAFQTEYGTLILYYNTAGKINKIQISSKTTDTIKLCE
ncbi:MAG TPA: hypothetical protein PK987_01280 [Ferruginibacter sp.]|nr:hypothetical protein [Ferruginibacter sp.]